MRKTGRVHRRSLLPILVLVPACGAGDPHATWSTAVDTLPGGAIRVVNTPPADGIRPSWILEEELRIGTVDEEGPSSFGQIRGIAALGDGGVAVLDAQAQEVRIFDAEGRHRATHGRKGAGPGELEAPYGLQAGPEGLLWVPDHRNARMTLFHPVRGFERAHAYPVLRYGFIWDGVVTDDGRVLIPSIARSPERQPILRVYDAEMTQIDSLPMPEPPEVDPKDPPGAFYWEAPGGLPRGYIGVPYYADGAGVLDLRGQVWSTLPGDPSYRILRWAPGGDTTLVIETRRPQVPVTQAERDSVIAEIRETLLEYGAARQDWSKIPTVKPGVEALSVAADGRLWVRTPDPEWRVVYDVHDSDGRYVGTAVTDLRVNRWIAPLVDGDRFWGVVTDDLGVQYVVRGRLRRAGDGG